MADSGHVRSKDNQHSPAANRDRRGSSRHRDMPLLARRYSPSRIESRSQRAIGVGGSPTTLKMHSQTLGVPTSRGMKVATSAGFPDPANNFTDRPALIRCLAEINSLFRCIGNYLIRASNSCRILGRLPARRPRRAKLPVFSQVAGNLVSETSSLKTASSSGESCKPSVAAAEKQHVTFADDRGDLFSDPNIVCGHPPAPAPAPALIAAWRRNVALLGAAITAARTLRAQQKPMPVIGYLDTGSLNAFPSYLAAFREGLG
jgi:hypothetical protein